MSTPRSTRIRKGVEVIDAGRRATVIRTTTLNVHGPMADLIYQDDESIGCAMIADLVRADEVAELLPATVYVTVRVNSKGKPLAGMFERKYRATDEAKAAELAASSSMTRAEYSAASSSRDENGVWTFTPSTGAPVHIRVTEHTPEDAGAAAQDAAEQAEADEPQTWNDVDVVARTEQLHPGTHPYRRNEVVEYVGPSGIGSWVHGPLHFRRMVEVDVAEIMTMSGPQRIEVADLRRPASNIAVELTPDDVARIFQALATEANRLRSVGDRIGPEALALTVELSDRFAALHP